MTLITNLDVANPSQTRRAGSVHVTSIASFLRPADTNIYASEDVINDSATSEEDAAIQFPLCSRDSSGSGAILRAMLSYEDTDATAAFRLFVFDAEPTNFLDNVALALLTADLPRLVAVYEFANANKINVGSGLEVYISDVAAGIGLPHAFTTESTSQNLYGLLVVSAGFTPASATKVHLRLQIVQD